MTYTVPNSLQQQHEAQLPRSMHADPGATP